MYCVAAVIDIKTIETRAATDGAQLSDAAHFIRWSLTSFKNWCRAAKLGRWPYRQGSKEHSPRAEHLRRHADLLYVGKGSR